ADGALTLVVPPAAGGAVDEARSLCNVERVVPLLALHRTVRAGIQRFYYADLYAFAPLQQSDATAKVPPELAAPVGLRAPAQEGPIPTPLEMPLGQPAATPTAEVHELRAALERERRENQLLRMAHQLHAHLARERNLAQLVHRVLAFAFDNLPADDGVF